MQLLDGEGVGCQVCVQLVHHFASNCSNIFMCESRGGSDEGARVQVAHDSHHQANAIVPTSNKC